MRGARVRLRADVEFATLVALLRATDHLRDANVGRGGVSQLQHALQTARAASDAGAPEWVIAVALLHDVGKALDDVAHPAIGAAIVQRRLGDAAAALVLEHGRWQDHLLHGTPAPPDRTGWGLAFARWDADAFDPDLTLTLDPYLSLIARFWG